MTDAVQAAKAYLSDIIRIDRECVMMERALQEMEMRITSLCGLRYGEPRGSAPPKSPTEEAVVRLLDMRQTYAEKLCRLYEMRLEAAQKIHALHRAEDREILIMRYIHSMKIGEIAKELHYTPRWVNYRLRSAIKEFALLHCFSS